MGSPDDEDPPSLQFLHHVQRVPRYDPWPPEQRYLKSICEGASNLYSKARNKVSFRNTSTCYKRCCKHFLILGSGTVPVTMRDNDCWSWISCVSFCCFVSSEAPVIRLSVTKDQSPHKIEGDDNSPTNTTTHKTSSVLALQQNVVNNFSSHYQLNSVFLKEENSIKVVILAFIWSKVYTNSIIGSIVLYAGAVHAYTTFISCVFKYISLHVRKHTA